MAIDAYGERIAPLFGWHGIEDHGASHDTLVAHLLADTELLGEVETDGILDQVTEEYLGAGIGKGITDISVEQRGDGGTALGTAQSAQSTVFVITAVKVGFVIDDIDSAKQETRPARFVGNGSQIRICTICSQQAQTKQGGVAHQITPELNVFKLTGG